MTEKYFNKFPVIFYRDKEAIDITRRVKIQPKDKNNPYNFYPFTLRDELRSDEVADFYYVDPELDWLVYHMNNIVDPYYDWYNTNEKFEQLLKDKYGSIETSKEKILFYRNNWYDDDVQIPPSHFDSTLPYNWKKYYMPEWGPKAEVLSYKRKEDDTAVNTNRILRYNVTYVSGNSYTIGEIIDIKYSGNIVAGGEVVYSNSSTLSIKHVSGNTIANSSVVVNITGETSATNATANSVTTVIECIPLDEEVFWSPVYYFEYEQEKNESRKHIQLINNELASLTVELFAETLNANT